jgi:hypothetical protein
VQHDPSWEEHAGAEEDCVTADLDLQGVGVGVVLEDELLEVQERPLVVHTLPDLIHKNKRPHPSSANRTSSIDSDFHGMIPSDRKKKPAVVDA